MTFAGQKRWLAISILTILAVLVGRDVARAQINETGDLSIELVDPKVLRVCADPHNLPFSNEKGEGFENKLAELFAEKLQQEAGLHVLPAGDRLRPNDARRPSLRRHHGLPARRRPGSGHQSLLPHRLCAGRQAGQRSRRRRDAGRRAPERQAYRHRGRHAAWHEHGGQRFDGERQAISVDGRYPPGLVSGGHDRRPDVGPDRRRHSVGTDGGLSMRRRRIRRFT